MLKIETDLFNYDAPRHFLIVDDDQFRFPFDDLGQVQAEKIELEDLLLRVRAFSRMAGKTDNYADADVIRAARSLGSPVIQPDVMDVVNVLGEAS